MLQYVLGCEQEAQKQYLQRELSEGLLCAVINNNTRCYNESTEFADHLDDALAAPYKVQTDTRHLELLRTCSIGASADLFMRRWGCAALMPLSAECMGADTHRETQRVPAIDAGHMSSQVFSHASPPRVAGWCWRYG